MKIVIITDAWLPQVNGVVVCIQQTVKFLRKSGHDVFVIGPDRFRNIPCPTYPEIRLALFAKKRIFRLLDNLEPDVLHINTEGPLGLAARSYAAKNELNYTTAFQTRFPEYIKARTGMPLSWTYAYLRWFHKNSERVLVPSKTVQDDLMEWKIGNPEIWSLGVDIETFKYQVRSFRPKLLLISDKEIQNSFEDIIQTIQNSSEDFFAQVKTHKDFIDDVQTSIERFAQICNVDMGMGGKELEEYNDENINFALNIKNSMLEIANYNLHQRWLDQPKVPWDLKSPPLYLYSLHILVYID